MAENQDATNKLLQKLELLLEKQNAFAKEVNELRSEITKLKSGQEELPKSEPSKPETLLDFKLKAEEDRERTKPQVVNQPSKPPITQSANQSKIPKIKTDLERFIGENLISKIGIAITVFGAAIGAKYSIDHDLISPLVRIILGYILGLGLLGIGLKLKTNYENYSAVLVSGAMAIMYFMTFAGFSFYGLFPQGVAFGLMVIFTVLTTYASLKYDKQVIALFGLVGAYAVPFILSDNSSNITVLLSYILIINIGILVLAFKKYWKLLYYSAFILTWLIYSGWRVSGYESDQHFGLALVFLFLFFITFYLTALSYKLLHKQTFAKDDILLLGFNSFIFYGLGYGLLDRNSTENLFGLFTLGNAILHGIVGLAIYKQKLQDRYLFYFVFGLALVFLTMSAPVQFDGNWVTLFWAGEAALLFWIGRTKGVPMYEKLSYPLIYLTFFSLAHDWAEAYDGYPEISPIINIQFLSSLLLISAFGFLTWLNFNKTYLSPLTDKKGILRLIRFSIPTILILSIYFSFWMEINFYWEQLNRNLVDRDFQNWNRDFELFKSVWLINYSILFLAILSFLNIKKLKNRNLAIVTLGLTVLTLWVFLSQGLLTLGELRESYLAQDAHPSSIFHLIIRYISFAIVAVLLMATYHHTRQGLTKNTFTQVFDLLLYGTVLWIASSEVIHWMDVGGESSHSYKLGLSIFWGIYALALIMIGIWQKKKKHLRIGAISLFGVTLLKLFFYDISHLDTISKTILFVSLGILLLVISFLYNKFKDKIE